MIENITRQDVENLIAKTIETINSSSDFSQHKFNVWVDGELVDVLTVPSYLADFYRSNPVFIEVTNNPIFE